MREELNQVDVCFVIDTTGSMSGFLQAAKHQLLDTMQRLRAHNGLDLHIGLVEYRDHPPQDNTFVTRSYGLTPERRVMEEVIRKLHADGGGDTPEAVYDGVFAACTKMRWRTHSARFALLVGDAPPHGHRAHLSPAEPMTESAPAGRRGRRGHAVHEGYGDTWASGCPCGLNAHSVTAEVEKNRIALYALCMMYHAPTVEAFTDLAVPTGGQCVLVGNSPQVMERIETILATDFGDLAFDRQVLKTVQDTELSDSRVLAEQLELPRQRVASSLARLGKRGLLPAMR